MKIKRQSWPISLKEVGLFRFVFVASIAILTLFTIAFFVVDTLLQAVDFLTHPFGSSFTLSSNLGEIISYFLVIVAITLLTLAMAYVIAELVDRPNGSWLDVKRLGERKSTLADLFVLGVAIVLFVITAFSLTAEWYHFYVFFMVAGSLFISVLSRDKSQEKDVVEPEEPDEDESKGDEKQGEEDKKKANKTLISKRARRKSISYDRTLGLV